MKQKSVWCGFECVTIMVMSSKAFTLSIIWDEQQHVVMNVPKVSVNECFY